ncbi:MAG: DUF6057 family protein [Tannerellaceae bacterium]|nr:DUF6057 family protein [Tannerellaceae bacterium]
MFLPWNNSMRHAFMLSDLYYHIGVIPSAQEMAFEAYVASNQGGSPRSLLRLVETNLISGEYRVAEKYISLLEKTLFYKKEATRFRQYLFNDQMIEENSLLGFKRGSFYNGEFVLSKNLVVLLEPLLMNPSPGSVALDYLTSILLLNKDLKKFEDLRQLYYGTEVWPELTIHQQEAVVAIYQNSPFEWQPNGVTKEVEQHFISFDQDMRQKRGNLNFEKIMEDKYGKTLWYHLIFVQQ